jgi:hypothetical protein
MLKRKLLSALVTMAVVGFGGYTLNASAATATGTANATIQTPLSIVQTLTMEFGTIAPDAAGGTVTLSEATGNTTGPANFVIDNTSSRAGRFTVTGQSGLSFTLSAIAASTLTGPGTAMVLNNFTNDLLANPSTLVGATQVFDVGADLVINANQTAGGYSGTYTVVVNYP